MWHCLEMGGCSITHRHMRCFWESNHFSSHVPHLLAVNPRNLWWSRLNYVSITHARVPFTSYHKSVASRGLLWKTALRRRVGVGNAQKPHVVFCSPVSSLVVCWVSVHTNKAQQEVCNGDSWPQSSCRASGLQRTELTSSDHWTSWVSPEAENSGCRWPSEGGGDPSDVSHLWTEGLPAKLLWSAIKYLIVKLILQM